MRLTVCPIDVMITMNVLSTMVIAVMAVLTSMGRSCVPVLMDMNSTRKINTNVKIRMSAQLPERVDVNISAIIPSVATLVSAEMDLK